MRYSLQRLLLLLFWLSSTLAYAQGEGDYWYLAYTAVHFTPTGAAGIAGTQLDSEEGSATVSGAAGNLLFYTDGSTIKCGFESRLFNGNIAGQRWRSRRDTVERAYGYRYDAANRLLQGDFVARSGPSQAWQGERSNHRMWGLGYDANGNLMQLRRRGLVQTPTRLAPALFAETDNLHYRYDPATQGNRLKAVDDLAPEPSLFVASRRPERPDFSDVSGSQDYAYDVNGSLLSDQNKRLTSIRYNHLHLPDKLVFATATAGVVDSLRFVYTATGQKVAKWVYAHGQPAVRTDYLGAWQYEADTLRWLSSAAGRALRQPDRTSGAITYTYEYSLKDHLGNLRVAFRRGQRQQWSASLEPGAASVETKQFDAASVSPPIASSQRAASGSYSAMLYANGTAPQPIGPTRLWTVQGGDTVRVEAFANYTAPVSGNSWHFALPTFLAGYLANPPAGNSDGGRTTRSFNWLQVGLAAGVSQLPSFGSGVPYAYLRLLVYQADSTVLADSIVPITAAARTTWEKVMLPRLVLPTGAAYAQVYVANESNVPVWFDDVKIEHGQGLQVQENHYDPFGLDLASLSRSTPGLRTLTQYQWNGKEKQTDFGLGWTHLDWRFFDAQTGRFHTVDPLSDNGQEMWSTYQFGFDNAVRYNDPDGRQAEGPGDPPTDIVNRAVLGLGISMFNVAAQGYAAVTGASEKWVADYAYDSEGTAVDYAYHKEPIGSAGQEAKSFGLDALNIGLSLYGGGGEAKLYEQAAGKVVAAEAVQAGKAAVQQGKAATKTYQTYVKPHPQGGKPYVGRTSGTGTPNQNIARRNNGHHMNKQGFGKAKLDKSSTNSKAIRGREQQMIDKNGGAKSSGGTSSNQDNGISPRNKSREEYLQAAKKEFGNP